MEKALIHLIGPTRMLGSPLSGGTAGGRELSGEALPNPSAELLPCWVAWVGQFVMLVSSVGLGLFLCVCSVPSTVGHWPWWGLNVLA